MKRSMSVFYYERRRLHDVLGLSTCSLKSRKEMAFVSELTDPRNNSAGDGSTRAHVTSPAVYGGNVMWVFRAYNPAFLWVKLRTPTAL